MSPEWNGLEPITRTSIEAFQDAAPIRLSELAQELGVKVKAATLAPGISGEIRPEGELCNSRQSARSPKEAEVYGCS